jgi:spore maturation protein CgeB
MADDVKRDAADLLAKREAQLRQTESRYDAVLDSLRYRLGDALLSGLTFWRDPRRARDSVLALVSQLRQRRSGRVGTARAQRRSAAVQPRTDVLMAAIVDEFTAAAFSPECEMIHLTAHGWRSQMERRHPDLLFVESAWNGVDGSWSLEIADARLSASRRLETVVAWCRDAGVPTVFWNKEDPAHFHRFISAAGLFDHVFTTDVNCVPAYRALLSHERVGVLPFAAQPALHHPPPDEAERTGAVAFAGSWNERDHPDRSRELAPLLDAAMPHGLDIYDRNHGTDVADLYGFPVPYRERVRGRLSYDEMVAAYRRYKVFLNVDSVRNSPTMLSRRVFELLASGTCVLSAESLGCRATFGDVVEIARDAIDARERLDRLLSDERYRRDLASRGREVVLEHHTYKRRFETVLAAAQARATRAPERDAPAAAR